MTIEDFNQIKDILLTEFDDFWSVKTLQEELQSENKIYFVIKQEQEVVGFVGGLQLINEIDIMNIVIKKTHRNMGLASKLMEHMIKYAKESSFKKITLEVNEKNITAIKLYEKYGFKPVGKRKEYYKEDTAIIMHLSLEN